MNRRVLLIGHPRRPEAYEVAERLVEGLTAAGIEVAGIADELAAFGITVNAISPNAATRMTGSIPEEKIAEVSGPIARFADPSEISDAVCFLGSEEAGYITGVVLPVDGGLSI